jgi:hypothetical protein
MEYLLDTDTFVALIKRKPRSALDRLSRGRTISSRKIFINKDIDITIYFGVGNTVSSRKRK